LAIWEVISAGVLGKKFPIISATIGTSVTVAGIATVVAGINVVLPGSVMVTAGRVVVIPGIVIVFTVVVVAQAPTTMTNKSNDINNAVNDLVFMILPPRIYWRFDENRQPVHFSERVKHDVTSWV
jgi:hypothetical protein